MSSKKKMFADLLFGIQVVTALLFAQGQFVRMLTTSQGVNISWPLCWAVFLGINLVLAFTAHRNQPSRVTRQTIASYALFLAIIVIYIGAMVWQDTGVWKTLDTATAVLAAVGVTVTLGVGRYHNRAISDPIVRGCLAIFFKFMPQLALAYNMLMLGAAGLSGIAVWNGHFSILTRLGQLYFSIREAGWDRNRLGSAISEIANEVSWLVVTIVWIFN